MRSLFTFPKLFTILLSATLLTAFSSCSNEDYDLFSSISGKVVDAETSEAISGAAVMLVPGNQTVQTDASGNFQFGNLEARQYTLSIQKSGYQANRKIVDAVSGETVTVFVQLEKIPTE